MNTTQSPLHELKVLISSCHSFLVIQNSEEERIGRLLRSAAAQLQIQFSEWSASEGYKSSAQRNQAPLQTLQLATDNETNFDSSSSLETLNFLKNQNTDKIVWLKDFSSELTHPPQIRLLREVVTKFSQRRSAVVISGAEVVLPPDLKPLAIHFEMRFPSQEEYRATIENVFSSLSKTKNVRLKLDEGQYLKMLELMRGLTLQQARQVVAQAFFESGEFGLDNLELVEKKKVQVLKEDGLLEYFPYKENAFELGGFAGLKTWLEKIETGFSEKARELHLPIPKGVLFVGVPGCGKSLAAKFIARKWRLPLLKLDAGRLYSKFIGETESNFRRVIQLAESIQPSVLWIDEIEKSFPTSSDQHDNDGGVSRRVFASFLTWLQEKNSRVYLVATANDLTRLPPELLRKGRFDEIFFVDLPDESERAQIFNIHFQLRKLAIAPEKLQELVTLSKDFSGAEIEQVVVGAGMQALQGGTTIGMKHLLDEIKNLIPLSRSRPQHLADLRQRSIEYRSVR